MKCFDQRKIQLFVDHRDNLREFGEMTTHLVHCAICRQKVEGLKQLSDGIKRSAPIYGNTEELESRILEKIEDLRYHPQWIAEPEPVSILGWIQPWAIQAAAFWIVAIILGGWLGMIVPNSLNRGNSSSNGFAALITQSTTGSLVELLAQRAERRVL